MSTVFTNTVFTNVAETQDGGVWWEGMDTAPGKLTDWKGQPWDASKKTPAAHPNSRWVWLKNQLARAVATVKLSFLSMVEGLPVNNFTPKSDVLYCLAIFRYCLKTLFVYWIAILNKSWFSRFCTPAEQCPIIDSNWESAEGVPISAILLGGRRPEGVPLVVEARDWKHGVFMGATMRSEATAAAEHSVSNKIKKLMI